MSIDLTVQQPLSTKLQPVQDQANNSSSLNLGTGGVAVGTNLNPVPQVFTVQTGNSGFGPMAGLLSPGKEASISFQILSPNICWNVGAGGTTTNSFFIWNDSIKQTVLTLATSGAMTLAGPGASLTVNGSVTAKGMTINGSVTANGMTANGGLAVNGGLTVQGGITADKLQVGTITEAESAPEPRRLGQLLVDLETGLLYIQK